MTRNYSEAGSGTVSSIGTGVIVIGANTSTIDGHDTPPALGISPTIGGCARKQHERHLTECIVFRRHCPAFRHSGPLRPDTPERSDAYYVVRWNRPYYPSNYFEI